MTAPAGVLRFPDGFVWGAATSAYQVEGAAAAGGRGASMWDVFCRLPGRVANGDTAEVSADHYHRWREDVALMAELGLRGYRFSIAWPRLLPAGRGPLAETGLAFYDRLVDALLEAGIEPAATLYHWDLPATLDEAGGWLARDTAEAFGAYAATCFDTLGDRVRLWLTVNEPWVAATLGYRLGLHAPGHRDLGEAVRASHHLLLAHGRAVQAFRASGREGRIGIALNLLPTYPATDSPDDAAAAVASDGYTNRWFLDPLLRGGYPDDTREVLDRLAGPMTYVAPDDAATIGSPIDMLGVNYYTRRVVRAGSTADGLPWVVEPATPGVPVTDAGWQIVPECLTDLLVRLRSDYGDVPIRITENGCVDLARPRPDGRVPDALRTRFLRDHVAALHRAIAAGVRVEGYYHWSLLDCFEWADGFAPRYGLVDVDYPTGRRIPKDSARYYAWVVAANGLDPAAEPWAPPAGAGTMRDRSAGGPAVAPGRATAGAADVG